MTAMPEQKTEADAIAAETTATRILFIHGFLDGASIWDAVRERLASVHLKAEAIDLAGMGGTDAPADSISLDGYADDVVAHIRNGAAPVILVGQSMGSQIADLVATRHPEMVAGLILLTPVPLAGARLPREVVAPFRDSGAKPDVQRSLREQLSFVLDQEQADALTALGLQVKPDVVARLVDVWNEGHAAGREVARYEGPVVVVRGAADPFVNESMVGETLARYPAATSIQIDDAGHWAHVEQPAAVAAALGGFVAGLRGASQKDKAGDWQQAFADRKASSFADAFAEDVELDASAMLAPVRGRDLVKKVMAVASRQYRELTFTDQATAGSKQYLEWRATGHDGVAYRGVTILTRDVQGAMRQIAIHHRPLGAAMHFSRALADGLRGEIDAAHFLESLESF
ncbi:MAG TPA: alpha/beta hydrolase [Acetobacteraceae bacterium]|nr:alpha/beta hydrolase [Acetobacteraceae bacterium]